VSYFFYSVPGSKVKFMTILRVAIGAFYASFLLCNLGSLVASDALVLDCFNKVMKNQVGELRAGTIGVSLVNVRPDTMYLEIFDTENYFAHIRGYCNSDGRAFDGTLVSLYHHVEEKIRWTRSDDKDFNDIIKNVSRKEEMVRVTVIKGMIDKEERLASPFTIVHEATKYDENGIPKFITKNTENGSMEITVSDTGFPSLMIYKNRLGNEINRETFTSPLGKCFHKVDNNGFYQIEGEILPNYRAGSVMKFSFSVTFDKDWSLIAIKGVISGAYMRYTSEVTSLNYSEEEKLVRNFGIKVDRFLKLIKSKSGDDL
jgi:hypothetical protein